MEKNTLCTALEQVGWEAAISAAKALSALLETDFNVIDFKYAVSSTVNSVNDIGLDVDGYYLGIFSKLDSDLKAYIIITLDMASATALVHSLVGDIDGTIDMFTESALQEFANILLGAFVSHIANEYQQRIEYTIPEVGIDVAQALLDSMLAKLSESEKAVHVGLALGCEKPPIELKAMMFSEVE